jgi:hypothetical protein
MENLQIPFSADETLHGGSYQTPLLETITHGQRDKSLQYLNPRNKFPLLTTTRAFIPPSQVVRIRPIPDADNSTRFFTFRSKISLRAFL